MKACLLSPIIVTLLLSIGFVSCNKDDDNDSNFPQKDYTIADLKGLWQIYAIDEEMLPLDSLAIIEYFDDQGNGCFSTVVDGEWKKTAFTSSIKDGNILIIEEEGRGQFEVKLLHLDLFSYAYRIGDVNCSAKKILDKDEYKEAVLGYWTNNGVTTSFDGTYLTNVEWFVGDSTFTFSCTKVADGSQTKSVANYWLFGNLIVRRNEKNCSVMLLNFGMEAGKLYVDHVKIVNGERCATRIYKRNLAKDVDGKWLINKQNGQYLPTNKIHVREMDYLTGRDMYITFDGTMKVNFGRYIADKGTIVITSDANNEYRIKTVSLDSTRWTFVNQSYPTDTMTAMRIIPRDFQKLIGTWKSEFMTVGNKTYHNVTMTLEYNGMFIFTSTEEEIKQGTFKIFGPLLVFQRGDGTTMSFIQSFEDDDNTLKLLYHKENESEVICTFNK